MYGDRVLRGLNNCGNLWKVLKQMTIKRPKKKRKMIPAHIAEDVLSGKKNPRSVGRMSDPDAPGPVILDREA